jgi:hypothetical protein
MRKELLGLLVSDTGVDQNKSFAVFDEQRAHGPIAHVVGVSRIGFLPDGFGNNPKHGAAVELKKSGIENV